MKGGTALHWAAYYGCEWAMNYLLAWESEGINHPDNEGLTPLHLGSMSGNSRVVKRLLIKGADRNIKDNKGFLPSDIAKENEYTNIERMLIDR
jgi:ankyrin repeat protein